MTNAADYKIGAEKLDATLKVKSAAAVDWTNYRSVMQICTNKINDAFSTLGQVHSGTGAGVVNCTTPLNYRVGEYDDSNLNITTSPERSCRWCTMDHAAGVSSVTLKDWAPPVTTSRYVSGISIWLSDTSGVTRFTPDTESTITKQAGQNIAAKGCASTGTIYANAKGQEVVFTITSPIPVAANQWLHFTNGGNPSDIIFGNE
jgi:hypothetical protein